MNQSFRYLTMFFIGSLCVGGLVCLAVALVMVSLPVPKSVGWLGYVAKALVCFISLTVMGGSWTAAVLVYRGKM